MKTREKYEKLLNELKAKRAQELTHTIKRKEAAAVELKKANVELDKAIAADDMTAYKAAKEAKATAEADLELSTAKEKRLNTQPYLTEEAANEAYRAIAEEYREEKLELFKRINSTIQEWTMIREDYLESSSRLNELVRTLNNDIMRVDSLGDHTRTLFESADIIQYLNKLSGNEYITKYIGERIEILEKKKN